MLEDAELSVVGYATTEEDAVAMAFKAKPEDVDAEKGELVAVDKASGYHIDRRNKPNLMTSRKGGTTPIVAGRTGFHGNVYAGSLSRNSCSIWRENARLNSAFPEASVAHT
ncbi:hypothetical protein [Azospirillum sp. BE72]|uniref:hypothetical protein n=1 Tax=Azospirillum sp. BE72 TaxID=2817776 RepID=UPI00285E8063|nr:hypothetical protein [Azospirillum sp. BE72]MDR6775147.1 transcriptional regulator GlxA family with amidase domain [Azospirillum sp. BE72]